MRKFLGILCLSVLILPGCSDQDEAEAAVLSSTRTTKSMFFDLGTTTTTTVATTTTSIKSSTTIPVSTTSVVTDEFSPNGVWDKIARCETPPNGDWSKRGYHEGGLQFHPNTWTSYVAAGKPYQLTGYPTHAYDASREQQITVAIRVRDGVKGSSDPYLNAQGWNAWPTCRHAAGV